MKVVKELPFSIWHSARLLLTPARMLKSNKTQVEAIVTLTSITSRLPTLHIVLRSLLDQSVLPKKIMLWLHEDEKIPPALAKLESKLIEIHYTHLRCPHKKLIGSMHLYPDQVLITCDDDVIYRKEWLETLWAEHLKRPKAVLAVNTVHINHDEQGQPLHAKSWRSPLNNVINERAFLPIGLWGTLYPPKSLHESYGDEELFLQLCPRADDLWFKAMALLQGTLSLPTKTKPREPIPIIGTQKKALKKTNVKKDGNTPQWRALSDHFNLPSYILKHPKS